MNASSTKQHKPDFETYPTLTRDEARAAAVRLLAMKGEGPPVDDRVLLDIERFIRLEARLLDEERYDEWYGFLADDLFYWMPLRENRFRRDKRPEFDPDSMALFDDRKADIAVRIGRLASKLVWTEDPPTRHAYIVSNVEAFGTGVTDEYEVHSTFLQYRNRSEHDEAQLVGRRRDLLRHVDGGFQIARRLILLPQAVLLTKTCRRSSRMRLAGYRAVVTGAGSGIGRAVVERYLAEGARVVAVVRNPDDAKALQDMGAIVIEGDVSRYETAERAVSAAIEAWQGLDVYVANAGLWDFHKRLERYSAQELRSGFDELFGVNLLGVLYGARASLEALRENQGSLIATGSNACFLAGGGGALYTASKFALRGLVMQLAKEFAPLVRVNAVAPGATDTGISGPASLGQSNRAMNEDLERMEVVRAHMPMGRLAAPADHTSLYVLLGSRFESSYITGAVMISDGGLTISV